MEDGTILARVAPLAAALPDAEPRPPYPQR